MKIYEIFTVSKTRESATENKQKIVQMFIIFISQSIFECGQMFHLIDCGEQDSPLISMIALFSATGFDSWCYHGRFFFLHPRIFPRYVRTLGVSVFQCPFSMSHPVFHLHGRDLWGGLGVDGRTILEWILKKLGGFSLGQSGIVGELL